MVRMPRGSRLSVWILLAGAGVFPLRSAAGQNESAAAMRNHRSDVVIGKKPTSGGSSETDVNDPIVKPTGSPSTIAVTTVTPVEKCPSTRRYFRGSIGWPALWLVLSRAVQWLARRTGMGKATFPQVLTVIVHASSIFAVRAVVAAPISYARESLGGATSIGTILPAFGESTFPARLAGAVDLFVLWWIVLVALGLSILYQTRTMPIARWLFGAYAGGAAALALTQAFRGGV